MPLFRRLRLPAMSAIVFALMSAIVLPDGAAAAPMKLADYLALSGPAPQASFRYGSAPSQYTELFLPAGAGPFPVALLVHGGCGTSKFGGIRGLPGAMRADRQPLHQLPPADRDHCSVERRIPPGR
jgi:hypothetical protein